MAQQIEMYVIQALGFGDERAHSSIRLSVGRSNDEAQVELALERIVAAVRELQDMVGSTKIVP